MALNLITTHDDDAVDRLIEQYKRKPNIENLIRAFVAEIQSEENALFPLATRLDVNAISGNLLDLFGTIVVQSRLGLNDAFYRLLLLAKIGVNVSNGEPERVISTFQIITNANLVQYTNLLNGEISLSTDGTIEDDFINFVFRNMQRTVAGGVRIDFITLFAPGDAFAFAGDDPTGKGFGDETDLAAGGKFASALTFNKPFAFDGTSEDAGGFGTFEDPLVGGVFVST